MLSRIRLPLLFDPAPLQADVAALPADDWVPHFNTSYYEGDWSGVAHWTGSRTSSASLQGYG